MLRVDLGNHHRNIGSPTMCGVVGYNGNFCLCIFLFDCADLFLRHINCGKYEIHLGCNGIHFVNVFYDQIFHMFGHRSGHFPSLSDCINIFFTGTSGACCYQNHFKPGMIFQQGNESLSNHTGCSQNTNS